MYRNYKAPRGIFSRGHAPSRAAPDAEVAYSHTLGDVVHDTSPSLSTSRVEVELRTHASLQALTSNGLRNSWGR